MTILDSIVFFLDRRLGSRYPRPRLHSRIRQRVCDVRVQTGRPGRQRAGHGRGRSAGGRPGGPSPGAAPATAAAATESELIIHMQLAILFACKQGFTPETLPLGLRGH
jgi:hypothetical protein